MLISYMYVMYINVFVNIHAQSKSNIMQRFGTLVHVFMKNDQSKCISAAPPPQMFPIVNMDHHFALGLDCCRMVKPGHVFDLK